jgi:chitinase
VGYNTVDPEADRANQVLLFQEFREQLDAFRSGLLLTTAIGAAKDKIDASDPQGYAAHSDWINVMTYDYHGSWASAGPTDFQANLFPDPESPNYAQYPDYNTRSSITTLLELGVPAHKLHLGVPIYGRGWTGKCL